MIRRFLQNTKNLETQMSLGWEKKFWEIFPFKFNDKRFSKASETSKNKLLRIYYFCQMPKDFLVLWLRV